MLSQDQNQMIFHVQKHTALGQKLYVVGSIPELGSWDPTKAIDAFHNPDSVQWYNWFLPVSVPKGSSFQYKYIMKDSAGNVTWEGGNNRSATSSSSPAGVVDLPQAYFQ